MGVGQGRGRTPQQKDGRLPEPLAEAERRVCARRELEEEGTVPAGAGSSGRVECAARVARQWDFLVPV